MPKELPILGTDAEVKLFTEVNSHYKMASEDLDTRITRKNGFDDADKMFASYIDEDSWPYRSIIFDPRPYTVILEKSARLIGTRPRGRLVPREGGDSLGAHINNELLDYQWDDTTRLGESMLSKWVMMDQNTRKYGSSFMLTKWRYEKNKDGIFFDGPDAIVCNNRNVLANPSYNTIRKWFQYREYNTPDELQEINDIARGEPVYKNLDLLLKAIKDNRSGKGDTQQNRSENKEMRGLTDYTGRDEYNTTVEIITEYRPDRWITFAPKHGVILRDVPNPYKHREIPVVHLKYYPLPDDLYGVSELEPVSKQIRAINAHLSAYSDTIALALRPPIHVNPVNVRMHTLTWDPEAKWLMNTPNVDVQQMRVDTSITQNFQSIYQTMVSSLLNALGENSQGTSNLNPSQDSTRITAAEIADTAQQRSVRDNLNQIYLSDAIKKQMMFWHSMDKQFMFKGSAEKQKIIRIVGHDAIKYFDEQGLGDIRPTAEDAQKVAMGQMSPQDIVPGPRFAVGLGNDKNGAPLEVPKFMPDMTGEGGNLILEEGDLIGDYDYIPDVETMKVPSRQETEAKLTSFMAALTNPTILQMLASEGERPKVKELLIKLFETTDAIKDAGQYFEALPPAQPAGPTAPPVMPGQEGGINGQTNQGGVPSATPGAPTPGSMPNARMGGSNPTPPAGGNPISGGRPTQV